MSLGVERAPDGHRFGRETAIGKADDRRASGFQYPPHLPEHGQRPLEILDADADEHGIEAAVGIGEGRVIIEVADGPTVELRIGRQFVGIMPWPTTAA